MTNRKEMVLKFIVWMTLVVWLLSIFQLLFLWMIFLQDGKETHFHLLMAMVVVAASVPLIVIIRRRMTEGHLFSKQLMVNLFVLWEILLLAMLVYYGLTALGSHHMPLAKAGTLKTNFNMAFAAHIVLGVVLLVLGILRKK